MALSNYNERMFDTQDATRGEVVRADRGDRSGRFSGRDVATKTGVARAARTEFGDIKTHRASHETFITTTATRFYAQALSGIQTKRNCPDDGLRRGNCKKVFVHGDGKTETTTQEALLTAEVPR